MNLLRFVAHGRDCRFFFLDSPLQSWKLQAPNAILRDLKGGKKLQSCKLLRPFFLFLFSAGSSIRGRLLDLLFELQDQGYE